MTNITSALTHPRPVSLDKAMSDCIDAYDLTDVHLAYACLEKLLERPRGPNENDADICDGVGAIVRLINESLVRRREAALVALKTMYQAIERERGQGAT